MARRSKKKVKPDRRDQGWLAWVLGSAENFDGYFARSRSLALSFVLIAPLLLVYEIALIYYPPAKATGAGRFLRNLFFGVFRTRAGVALNVVVIVLLLLAIVVLARRGGLRLNLILPMLLESAGWTVVLVGVGVLIYHRMPTARLDLGGSGSVMMQNVIGSIGAGVYEEIVFRLLLTSGLYWLGLKLFQERPSDAAVFAVLLSAVVFALCHVLAPGAVSLRVPLGQLNLFFFFTCGVFWSVLYTYRGLGVAVYTHVLYDIIVLLGG